MTPGEVIRERREGLDLSIAELARRSGIARERLSKIENGHLGVGQKTADALAVHLGVSASELMPPATEPANLTTLLLRVDGQGGLLRQVATDVHRIRQDLDVLLAQLAELGALDLTPKAASRARRRGSLQAENN